MLPTKDNERRGSPVVSVIVPTTGSRGELLEALTSVQAQIFADWECIVVLDGHNLVDGLPADARIRVVRPKAVRRGPAAARNSGMAEARGTYLAFLDDDDLWQDDRLTSALAEIGGAAMHICGLSTWAPPSGAMSRKEGSRRLSHGGIHLGQVLVRRELALPFDEALRVGEDVEWWIRMSSSGPVVWGEAVGYRLRVHDEERVGVDPQVRLECRRAILEKHRRDLRGDRSALAHHTGRLASAALLAGEHSAAIYW